MHAMSCAIRAAFVTFALLASVTARVAQTSPAAPKPTPASPVIYLDQAWTQADRELYYQIPQGSQVISYDIFLNLEVAGGQELFRSDANSDRYGLVPQPANPRTNPDGLPIGLTKTVFTEGRWKGETVGMTCAACHNGDLTYQGKRIRIDGGFNHTFDFMAYTIALDDALQATRSDSAKFDRLAAKLGATGADAKRALRERFEQDAGKVHVYRTVVIATPVTWGPGRIDAFNLITTRMLASATGLNENWSAPMAPVKPPFVWNAPQGSWTQWSGSVQDPIGRNHGETLGVFASIDFHSKTPEEGLFDTSAMILNLQSIEHLLSRLAPPKWPEETLGKIDRTKAAAGKVLFAKNCAECHNAYPYTWTPANKYGKRYLEVGLVPQPYVGTDPAQFESTQAYALTGGLAPFLPPPMKDQAIVPVAELRQTLTQLSLRKALAPLHLSEADMLDLNGYREMPLPPGPANTYKAAPRDGVWATAPFMHNGSVPSLYQMLIPAAQRTKKFYVGREFDPVKVGIDTSGRTGAFVFDTTLPGNSNAGHSFQAGKRGNGVIGPLLTDKQRWELVEYLKSIPEDAGRITPFGGPTNAVSGKGKWIKVAQ